MNTIELTKEQAEEFQATGSITLTMPEEKPKQCEPSSPKQDETFYYVAPNGNVCKATFDHHINMLLYGNVYLSEAEAYADAETDRKRNRMRAWLRENDDGWVADWGDGEQSKWYVQVNHYGNKWVIYSIFRHESIGMVYMSSPKAEELCNLLNSGEVVL
jgi:hypothetical protein